MTNLVLKQEMTRENAIYRRYQIGAYDVTAQWLTGIGMNDTLISVSCNVPYSEHRENYLPEIYFDNGVFGNGKPEFKIQTASYGSLLPEEIQKVIAGYNTALEIVEVLTKRLID